MKRILATVCVAAVLLAFCRMVTAEQESFAPGDVYSDGAVNNRDVGVLQRYLNDWDMRICIPAADVNGDGCVNNKDMGLLQQYVNEWEVTLCVSPLANTDYVRKTITDTLINLSNAIPSTAISVRAVDDAARCAVMGGNWCPRDAFLVNEALSQSHLDFVYYIDLPMSYPAGSYRLGATVTTSDPNASRCTVRLYNGSTLVTAAELPVNRGTQTDVWLGPTTSFNRIAVYSGSGNSGSRGICAAYSNVCLSPLNQSALTYTPYIGTVYSLPTDEIIATHDTMYLFSDTGSALETTYLQPSNTTPAPNDYYFEDEYLQNKAAVINDLLKNSGDNAEAFIFVADPHTEQSRNAGQTPSLVHYLCTQTDLSRAIIGGDVYVGASADYAAAMAEAFSDGTVHYVMGNHEYDRDTTDGALADLYDEGKAQQIGNADRHYYYVDSPENKLRYVVLNGFKEGSVDATDIAVQNEWLKKEALCVEEGWGILVFCHQFVAREWQRPYDHRYLLPAIKPIAKTLLEYDGAGEILAVFHGHIHQDMVSRMYLKADGTVGLDDGCGGIPLIGTVADKYQTDKETAPYEMLIDREKGTITEQAFDVVVVDREAGQIHCVRIGAPARDGTGWLTEKQVEVRTVNMRE